MKPVRLTVKGFTSFREETTVEFEGRQLFVITGPTGAGKSSLLDAITWALYGQVPRVGKSTGQLLSHGEATMWVHFEFSTRGAHYRVSRRRPATTGTRLERQGEDGSWVPLADRSGEVTKQVTSILGLDFTTFTRTVLLPQGAFDAFLRGEQRERREILTNLLGLNVYSEARAIAGRRASNARRDAQTIREQREALHLATPEEIAQLEATLATAGGEAAVLTERREALSALGELARAMRDVDRDTAAATKTADEAREAEARAVEAVAAAESVIAEASAIVARTEVQVAELAYDAEAHATLRERAAHLERIEHAHGAVRAAEQELTSTEAVLEHARVEERSATEAAEQAVAAAAAAERGRSEAAAALSQVAARAQRAATRIRSELLALAERRDALISQASERTERARQLGGLLAQYRAARARHQAALAEAETAVQAAQRAEVAAADADEEHEQARALLESQREEVEEARRGELAADLRRTLAPGDACPVCGEPIRELVSADISADLAAAEHALNDRERALGGAVRVRGERREQYAAAQATARAAARTVVEAEREMNELVQQIGFAGVTADALEPAMTTAEADARLRMNEASEVTASLEAAQTAERALAHILARMPEGIALAEGGGAAGEDAIGPLEQALDRFAQAIRGVERARVETAEAGATLDGRRRLVAAAEQSVEQVRRALDAARAQLRREGGEDASGADVTTDRATVRAALEAAEAAAARRAELQTERAAAETARTAATARLEMAQSTLSRATVEAEVKAAALEEARRAHDAAREAFATAWQDSAETDSQPSVTALKELMEAQQRAWDANLTLRATAEERLATMARQTADAARMSAEIEQHEAEAALAGALETDLRGPNFIAFVQQEAMELLAADATHHLSEFTNGRYELVAESDQFAVIDRFNGDERRSVKTLSGGETFLASLALALSLSEHLPGLSNRGGIVSLESLFLDEGFGSLDRESLDLAVQGLETLAGGQRMIGVISHVPELAERIPDRIEVRKGELSSSVVAA